MPKRSTKGDTKEKNEEPKLHTISGSEGDSNSEPEEKRESVKKGKKGSGAMKRGVKKGGEDGPEAKKEKSEVEKPETDLKKMNFDCEKKSEEGEKWNLKVSSWNVAGLRAWAKKNGMDYMKSEDPDIFCLQETKCGEKKLPPEVKISGYHTYWLSGEKEGFNGVALYSKEKPISVKYGIGDKEFDNEGRVITAEFEEFYLINAYVPNAGRGLKTLPKRMKWDPEFRNYLKKLDEEKPIILCGDLNVAHTEIDLANPKTNTKSAGFTPEEREGMTELLKTGFVDSFRKLYPKKTGAYTFWSYLSNARAKNTGWRLDYFILSERLLPHLCDNVMRSGVYGSDHCPITLFLHV